MGSALTPTPCRKPCASGYVAIAPDPEDGRAKRVRLIRRGRQVWDTLGELSAEVEADFARTMGLSKWRNCAGCCWNCQGHRRASKRIKLARRQRLCTPFQPSSADGSFYNRRKPHILMA